MGWVQGPFGGVVLTTWPEITAKYQHHVIYVCKVRKYGTLVYRPTSLDIHALLSEAL